MGRRKKKKGAGKKQPLATTQIEKNITERKAPYIPMQRAMPHANAISFNMPKFPRILMTQEVYDDTHFIVDNVTDEVGWLGAAKRVDPNNIFSDILIYEIFLVKQKVSGTETEIQEEGLVELADEILARPDGLEIWENIRFWGHSHPNFDTKPSGQDVKQFEELSKDATEFFVRGIINKKGKFEFCLNIFPLGVQLSDLAWEIVSNRNDEREAMWKQQIADKVSKRYVTTYNGSTYDHYRSNQQPIGFQGNTPNQPFISTGSPRPVNHSSLSHSVDDKKEADLADLKLSTGSIVDPNWKNQSEKWATRAKAQFSELVKDGKANPADAPDPNDLQAWAELWLCGMER